MLVRRAALARAGGIGSIRHALIDDCALAARLKRQGPIWLGLTERVQSLRTYPAFADIRRMVARSAYAQLRFSPWLLAATIALLALAYLAAPLIALAGSGLARWIAVGTWMLMGFAFWPTLRFYGLRPLSAPALPALSALDLPFPIDSPVHHPRRPGGFWKGPLHPFPAAGP